MEEAEEEKEQEGALAVTGVGTVRTVVLFEEGSGGREDVG